MIRQADLVKAFKDAWLDADAKGQAGHRPEAGLEAVRPLLEEAVVALAPYGMALQHDGTEDKETAAYVEGVKAALDAVSEAFR